MVHIADNDNELKMHTKIERYRSSVPAPISYRKISVKYKNIHIQLRCVMNLLKNL